MIKKFLRNSIVLGLVVFVSLLTNTIVNATVYDINMNKSYSNIFSNGKKVEYHVGNIIPTDDVSGRAGKSLEAYAGRSNYLKVEVKGVSGGYGRRSASHTNRNGDTWFHTQWTNDPFDDDTAEYAKYWINGTLIELR